jgi:hypothetical protein
MPPSPQVLEQGDQSEKVSAVHLFASVELLFDGTPVGALVVFTVVPLIAAICRSYT